MFCVVSWTEQKPNSYLEKQNPVSWQVSADGQRMIGHMILRKNTDGEDILGLKIVGGKTLSSSRKGAVIEKVKRGSIADQEGHLKPGKTLDSLKLKNHDNWRSFSNMGLALKALIKGSYVNKI